MRRRTAGLTGPVHLSLSGGHDSRGLLSLLTAAGCDVRTFSYAQGAQLARSDASMASPLAEQYGARHERVRAYRGDLVACLRRNARWGRGPPIFATRSTPGIRWPPKPSRMCSWATRCMRSRRFACTTSPIRWSGVTLNRSAVWAL
ncbi:asparagine synthase-related protein [Deinococcus radiopugnans]|uniref:asparagine synthase-related protein n=1 Tax=Deinococcus radiopugnans TaxID=57497 RepID=UPI003617215D